MNVSLPVSYVARARRAKKRKMSVMNACDVVARRLRGASSEADIAECSRYIRVGGELSVELLNAVVAVAHRDDVFREFLLPDSPVAGDSHATTLQVVPTTEALDGTVIGDQQNRRGSSPAWTDALLELLFEVVCASASDERSLFARTHLPAFFCERFLPRFLSRAHMLTETQRAHVAPILHKLYARFPLQRRAMRDGLYAFLQVVSRSTPVAAFGDTDQPPQTGDADAGDGNTDGDSDAVMRVHVAGRSGAGKLRRPSERARAVAAPTSRCRGRACA
jgi:hypothetical protein